jgi:hypothetical protein
VDRGVISRGWTWWCRARSVILRERIEQVCSRGLAASNGEDVRGEVGAGMRYPDPCRDGETPGTMGPVEGKDRSAFEDREESVRGKVRRQ